MTIRPILTHPDPRLRRMSKDLEGGLDVNQPLFLDMIETMRSAKGIGLAAPQIGVESRVFVVDVGLASGGESEPVVFVNPVILKEATWKEGPEGCLSIPGRELTIWRAQKVRVKYLDGGGVEREKVYEGLAAVAIQHELDHLDGVLMIDRVDS